MVNYTEVLEDLIAKRADIDAAIAAIQRISGIAPVMAIPRTAPPPGVQRLRVSPLPERIIEVLSNDPQEVFTIEDLVGGLSSEPKSTRSALARLAGEGRIKKVRRGVYASAQFAGPVAMFDDEPEEEEEG